MTCGNAMKRSDPRADNRRLRRSRPRRLRRGLRSSSGGEPSHGEGHREYRQIGRHQGRAERQRRPDHRRPCRRHDSAARARADDRPERPNQGAGVRQVGHRARRSHRQRHGQRQGRHPRQRLGRRRHRLAARRDRRRRAFPRQRRHAAQGRRRPAGRKPKPAAVASRRAAPSSGRSRPAPPQRVGDSTASNGKPEVGSGIGRAHLDPDFRLLVHSDSPTPRSVAWAC